MSRTCFARTAVIVALLALAGGILLPTEHVHYARDGHHAAVVHRHFSAASSPAAIHVADDDDHGQELHEAWLARRPFVFPFAAGVAFGVWGQTPPQTQGLRMVPAALRIDHGPPFATPVLRGPPLPV